MCIVIDTNCFSYIFNKTDKSHKNFEPVYNWIIFGKGKLVYGGTKYKEELRKAKKYFGLLKRFKAANKIVKIDDKKVDAEYKKLEKIKNADFDDPHLIAIIIESGCRLICSVDKRAYKFIKNKKLYPSSVKPPKIYKKESNKNLLADKNIAAICQPAKKPNKSISNMLKNLIN